MDKNEVLKMANLSGIDRKEALHFDHHQQARFATVQEATSLIVDPGLACHSDGRIVMEDITLLQIQKGQKALIPGCGEGIEAVALAQKGAMAVGVDISFNQCLIAQQRLMANRCDKNCFIVCASFHHLPFREDAFHAVLGHAVLHHVDVAITSRHLAGVLRPGARYVFSEPLGENPVLGFVRSHMPYPGKHRSPDEHPLRYADINQFQIPFIKNRIVENQLLSMIERVLPWKKLARFLDRIDKTLLSVFPFLRKFCRYVIITGEKGTPQV